jgi:hypothetical protein
MKLSPSPRRSTFGGLHPEAKRQLDVERGQDEVLIIAGLKEAEKGEQWAEGSSHYWFVTVVSASRLPFTWEMFHNNYPA